LKFYGKQVKKSTRWFPQTTCHQI